MNSILGVYGASGFGREVMPVCRQLKLGEQHELVFIDDGIVASHVNGSRLMGFNDFVSCDSSEKSVVLAIADGSIRARLARNCAVAAVGLRTIRSPDSVVYDDVEIGEGSVICAYSTLTSNIKVGRCFHANVYSYVAHDCVIGDFVTFAPGVKCLGNVTIEDGVYVGAGAVIKQSQPGRPVRIGSGAVIGMGAVVTKSVPAGVTVIGNPARPMNLV